MLRPAAMSPRRIKVSFTFSASMPYAKSCFAPCATPSRSNGVVAAVRTSWAIRASALSALPSMVLKATSNCWNWPLTLAISETSPFIEKAMPRPMSDRFTLSLMFSNPLKPFFALALPPVKASIFLFTLSSPPLMRSRSSISIATVLPLLISVYFEKILQCRRLPLRRFFRPWACRSSSCLHNVGHRSAS